MRSILSKIIRGVQKQPPPSDLLRVNIGIFGKMNSGKSLLMNRITQHETSIVDSTPGTTADVKIALLELHELGPVKLFDTPGTDEMGILGEKKRTKTYFHMKQCDLIILVLRPFEGLDPFDLELIESVKEKGKKIIVMYNVFEEEDLTTLDECIEDIEDQIEQYIEMKPSESIVMNLSHENLTKKIHSWIEDCYVGSQPSAEKIRVSPIPETNGSIVFLNIPMDELTPSGRLLRPQAVVQEECIRNFLGTFAYRMNLGQARSEDESVSMKEKERFLGNLYPLVDMGCELLITDSQAMDIIGPWTLDDRGEPIVDITTFSISMANLMSQGQLHKFLDGVKRFDELEEGDSVLIVEACSHNRIQDDIGTVQIPKKIEEKYGEAVKVDFAFGKGYQAINLSDYEIAIHCGGCMLDRQSMNARIADIEETGIPITNYGLLLSYFESKESLRRVVKPWGYVL